jgi:DNA polymerase IV
MRPVGHVDLDAFFASAAILAHPELKGTPVAVGGDSLHGVVSTANYEARKYGVHSGMRMREAKRLCPQLAVVGVDFSWYRELSFEVLCSQVEVCEKVEPAGIDESYLRFYPEVGFDEVEEVAEDLRGRIQRRTGLTASVGVGISRGVAKLASAAAKPDGVLVVPPENTVAFLGSRRLVDLGGAGPATMARLSEMGVHSVRGLALLEEGDVRSNLGETGVHLWRLSRGEDGTAVVASGSQVSVGAETTLEQSAASLADFEREVLKQAREALSRLRRLGRGTSGVAVKARSLDRRDLSRAESLGRATNDEALVLEAVGRLIPEVWADLGGAVRLVGVTLTGLSDEVQPRLDLGGSEVTWKIGRAPRAGERVSHPLFGEGEVAVGDPDSAVVRFPDKVRVISDPRKYLTRLS